MFIIKNNNNSKISRPKLKFLFKSGLRKIIRNNQVASLATTAICSENSIKVNDVCVGCRAQMLSTKFAAPSPEHKSLERALEKIHSTLQSDRCKSQQLSAAKFVGVLTTQIRAGFSHTRAGKLHRNEKKKKHSIIEQSAVRSVQPAIALVCVCLTYKLDEIVIQQRGEAYLTGANCIM